MELIFDLMLVSWKQIIFISFLVVGFIFILLVIYHYLLNIESMAHSLKRIEENTTTIAERLHQLNETYEALHKDLKSIEQSLKERIIWPPSEP
jgi:predicted Holliday junction resolvase-like endonuclease